MKCQVCLDSYSPQRVPISLPCGHTLCGICEEGIQNNKTCPFCRGPYERCTKNFQLIKCLEETEIKDDENIKGVFKIILIGDSYVGKTAFKYYLEHNKFNQMLKNTVFSDFSVIKLKKRNKVWAFNIWDTAGQERFKSLGRTHYVKSDVVILVYDITSPQSLQNIRGWIKDVNEQTPDSKLFLIGNKNDLARQVSQQQNDLARQVSQQQANTLAREINAKHYLVSCMTGQNIQRTWEEITDTLIQKIDQSRPLAIRGSVPLRLTPLNHPNLLSRTLNTIGKRCC